MHHLHLFEDYGFPRPVLLLDLDNTLVFAHDPQFIGNDRARREYFSIDRTMRAEKRPHLDAFLDYAFAHFRVGIFTARNKGYATKVLKGIGRPLADYDAVYTGEKCRVVYGAHLIYHEKDLTALRHPLTRVLLLDDKPEGCAAAPDNLIPIKPYWGGSDDRELQKILPLLDELRHVEDVRAVDKTKWSF